MISPKLWPDFSTMRKVSVILLLAFAALLVSYARAPFYDLGEGVGRLDYHVRLRPSKSVAARCSLLWNYADADNYTAMAYTMPPRSADDPHLGMDVEYSLFRRVDGCDSLIAAGVFASHYPTGAGSGFSAVLSVDETVATVALGGKEADFRLKVPFERINPGRVGYTSPDGLEELRHDMRVGHMSPPRYSRFETVDSLKEYVKASGDPMEALWTYLDRDMKPDMAYLGGEYRLATVAERPGVYSIVYLGGERDGQGIFRPLQLKGLLRATVFAGHYGLVWYDAAGRVLDKETSATVELDGLVLRLGFPLYGASVRFSKVPVSLFD